MDVRLEQLNPHTPDNITLAAASLIVNETFADTYTVEGCLYSLTQDGVYGYALVENEADVVGAVTISHDMEGDTELTGIAVREDARGRGLGAALVRLTAAQALERNNKKVWAGTAIPSYFERFGFTEADDIEQEGEDLKLMKAAPLDILTANPKGRKGTATDD